MWALWVIGCIILSFHACGSEKRLKRAKIFHLIDNANWGEVDGTGIQGKFNCPSLESCKMYTSDCNGSLVECLRRKQLSAIDAADHSVIVAMYHIHSWGAVSTWPHAPNNCLLPAHYSMAESEESHGRFHKLFGASFATFDGNSTTHPHSSVPRTYFSGLNASEFLQPKPFTELINGASFVASTCHRGEGTTKRLGVVMQMQALMRVDSLGRCHTTRHISEGISLRHSTNAQENLRLKQAAISNYLFYCAFENTYERGYVTEKVFDALIAGVVPIYLGPSEDCRPLLPHPKAAIFFDDFGQNVPRLVAYLQYLSRNETAYEEHRAWRKTFDPAHQPGIFAKSWPCRICEWAVTKATADPLFAVRDERMWKYLAPNTTCK